MADINELLQKYVDMDYDQHVFFANESIATMKDGLNELFGDDENVAKILLVVVAACLGTDNKLTSLESRFLSDVLGVPHNYQDNLNMVAALGDDESRDMLDTLVDQLSGDAQAALLSFCLTFMAVDETISREEVSFIKRLLD